MQIHKQPKKISDKHSSASNKERNKNYHRVGAISTASGFNVYFSSIIANKRQKSCKEFLWGININSETFLFYF